MSKLHVILGEGQVGKPLARELLARGESVRQVRRSAVPEGAAIHPGLTRMSGDLCDRAFAEEAMRGADVIYDCLNPTYNRWHEDLPPLRRGLLFGVARSGAKLVQLDNLYMYGAPEGRISEETPIRPASRKGTLRAGLAADVLAASERGEIRVAIARASDFFGPGYTRATIFGSHFYERLVAGRSVFVVGDPDQPHSYSYGPDVVRGMIALAEAGEDVVGQVWHLPVEPAQSTRVMIGRFAQAIGRGVRVQRIPDLALRVAGLFAPMMREVLEMTYQWKKPFVLDDSKFRGRFDTTATSMQPAVEETAKWAMREYRGMTEKGPRSRAIGWRGLSAGGRR
jgi:nucleoside-diphosphate-sugar epimerase